MKDDTVISFTGVVIQESDNDSFYGVVRGHEGVLVKGKTEEEVFNKIPKAFVALLNAKSKYSKENGLKVKKKSSVVTISEKIYSYADVG